MAVRPEDTRKRVALKAFRVIVEHAIAAVPVAGPFLSFGLDLIMTVKEEVDEAREKTAEEIVQDITSLEPQQREEAVDESLSSPAGEIATAGLSHRELLQLRRRLVELPSELGRTIALAEAEELVDRRRAAELERARKAQQERQTAAERTRLEHLLHEQMNHRDWRAAYKTVNARVRLGNVTRDVKRAEKIIYRKAGSLHATATGVLIAIACVVPAMVIALNDEGSDLPGGLGPAIVALVPLIPFLTILGDARRSGRLSRRMRGTLLVVALLWALVVWLYAVALVDQVTETDYLIR